jgi:aryl-alcohol dehydrogenase-like predicted oxidoreductase
MNLQSRASASHKLGLGTVQFGTTYGVSNVKGKLTETEVKAILELACDRGVSVLDTASVYGDSELMIGTCLPKAHAFRIVTKTPSFRKGAITSNDVRALRSSFQVSLKNLRQESIYGLLMHQAEDLLAKNGVWLYEEMSKLKAEHLVEKIGVSVYTGEQIDRILDQFVIDLIQLPVSVMDQRLIADGHVAELRANGVEIHARSIFLQGLLLMPVSALNSYFDGARENLANFETIMRESGLSTLEGALAYVNGLEEIDRILIGVCSAEELEQILQATDAVRPENVDFTRFACYDEKIVNPSMWRLVK